MSRQTLVAIGKIVKAFGIRGDVVILPMTDTTARFKKLKRVFVGTSEADARETTVATVTVEQRGVRLRLISTTDRTGAEKLVGSLLFVDEQDTVRLPKGAFFVHDIVGLNVVDTEGNAIGVVKDVLKYPASDVYVVDYNGREVLVPAVKEYIKKIDLETKTMRVKIIEGMLDDATEDERENDAD